MIPVIYRKADYLKTLKYVLGKEEAQVIDSNIGGSRIEQFNKQFLANRNIRPELKNPCAHLILSIANNDTTRESLNDEQWTSVARKYLKELEYLPKEHSGVPSQYVVVRHHDREHEHLHIIASQIRFDGTKVNDSFDYFKAQTATRLIAHEMGLEVTPTSSKAISDKLYTEYGIDAAVSDNRSKSIRSIKCKTNEPSAKDTIKDVLLNAIDESNNMPEFLDKVESKQVYPIVRLDKNQEILGFAYTHKGVTIAASQINRKLSWNNFKDSLKFNIKYSDLQLILLAREKALADISKHKSKSNSESGDNGSRGSEERPAKSVVKPETENYISVVPSIESVFPSSTQHKGKIVTQTEVTEVSSETATREVNQSVDVTLPSIELEPTPPLTSTNPNSDSNISIDQMNSAVRITAAYMASVNKTEIDGDTLTARLDGNNLVLKDLQSGDTLIEAKYSIRTNQWAIKQSELLTRSHLKRIAQLQRRMPKYEIQMQNDQNAQEQ
ncbi:MAG: relaxase/mobilization nuclease domain-containing protein [Richelia sp. RM1_1_1]|nr:relaxase/mobilization nuclease domain-containing protein [Richelia sp. RM1_1_1]